jgi:hypothetical protein
MTTEDFERIDKWLYKDKYTACVLSHRPRLYRNQWPARDEWKDTKLHQSRKGKHNITGNDLRNQANRERRTQHQKQTRSKCSMMYVTCGHVSHAIAVWRKEPPGEYQMKKTHASHTADKRMRTQPTNSSFRFWMVSSAHCNERWETNRTFHIKQARCVSWVPRKRVSHQECMTMDKMKEKNKKNNQTVGFKSIQKTNQHRPYHSFCERGYNIKACGRMRADCKDRTKQRCKVQFCRTVFYRIVLHFTVLYDWNKYGE